MNNRSNWPRNKQTSLLLPGNNILILTGVLVVGLILAIYFGISIGQGDYFETYMVLLVLGTPAVLFLLKANYWLIIPFAIRCGLPAIPLFAGKSVAFKEVWIVVSVAMLAGQFLLYRSRRTRFERIEFIPLYLIMAWVVVMFFREGIGLSILGSTEQGGRKYLGIILAFFSLLVIAHQHISEKQCKWLIRLILSAAGVAMVVRLINYFFFRRTDYITEQWASEHYTYHQILSSFPLALIIWVFSKYSPAEIIVRLHMRMVALLGVSYAVIFYSGKRMHLALALVVPAIAALIRRQYGSVVMYGASAVVFLSVLLVGQGSLFNLPLSAERALSFVAYIPGVEWKSSTLNVGKTNFRETLNEIALDKIAEHPITGNGLAVSLEEIKGFEAMEQYATVDVDSYAFKMAAGSAWHNTWLGISTDFGIPCALLFAVFWLQMFRYAFRLRRQLPVGSYARLLVTMILLMNCGNLLQSWVAGHSLDDVLWSRAWQLGILLAIRFNIETWSEESTDLEQEKVKV